MKIKKDIYKIAQSIINKRLGVVKTASKNTFKTALVLLSLALFSCEKISDLKPIERINSTTVHIYTDCSVVEAYINGEYYEIGDYYSQQMFVLKVSDLKTISAFRVLGYKSSLTLYFGNTRMHYGDFKIVNYDKEIQ